MITDDDAAYAVMEALAGLHLCRACGHDKVDLCGSYICTESLAKGIVKTGVFHVWLCFNVNCPSFWERS